MPVSERLDYWVGAISEGFLAMEACGNAQDFHGVAQDGREALMRPGDFVLVDARRPYHFDFDAGPSTVSLELPLAWLTRWVAEPEAHTARPFRVDGVGWGTARSQPSPVPGGPDWRRLRRCRPSC